MVCEIIAVGTEILLGDIVNTNAQYLSQELSQMGIDVYYQDVVGDNEQRLSQMIRTALDRSDIVILTGGLGPTEDDITKETAAKVLGVELKFDQASYDRMREYFQNRPMSENNKKQAYVPVGSVVLRNDHGTAPGCILDTGEKIVMVLPGPPFEMKPMFERYGKPYLKKKTNLVIKSKFLKVFGVGESNAAQMLKDLIEKQTNPTIAPYAKMTEALFRITAKAGTEEEADALIAPCEQEIRARLGDSVYGVDDDTIESVTVGMLLKRNLKVAVAESCTAGLTASKIASVAGASAVLDESYVTYANAAKEKLLGVSGETLEKFGAVSEETAREMAEGVQRVSGADIGLSITGIAGPDGGSPQKPVGLVWIGIAYRGTTEAFCFHFSADRNRNRELAACNALNIIRKTLIKGEKKNG